MNRTLAGGFLAVLVAEVIGVIFGWRWALPAGGVAVALFGFHVAGKLRAGGDDGPVEPAPNEALESLQRWKAQTEEMIRWADSTRGDWDRYLRPKLAGDFLAATRQKEPAAIASTGRLVFGEELWRWVDPQNVSPAGRNEPGPGRAVLDDILQRLEHV